MSRKKMAEDESSGKIQEGDPFEPQMDRASPDLKLDGLTQNFSEQLALADRKKLTAQERIRKSEEGIVRLNNYIAQLKAKVQQDGAVLWVTSVVGPLAEDIQRIFASAVVDVVGPIGLAGATTITVSARNTSQQNKVRGENAKSITLVPGEGGKLFIRDYSRSTNEFKDGSLGALSGMNFPLVEVPPENAVQTIVDWLLK